MKKQAEQNTNFNNLVAVIYADTVWQLANKMIFGSNVPDMTAMREGMKLVPGFTNYFTPVEVDEEGQPLWANKGKRELFPMQYEQFDRTCGTLLEYIKEIEGVDMKLTSSAMLAEKKRKDPQPVVPSIKGISIDTIKAFEQVIAAKTYFWGDFLINNLRKGRITDFNPKKSRCLADFESLEMCKLEERPEDMDPTKIHHAAEEPMDAWCLGEIVRQNQNVFELDPVEMHKLNKAFEAWKVYYHVMKEHCDLEVLKDEIRYQTERTEEYIKQRDASNPFKGAAA